MNKRLIYGKIQIVCFYFLLTILAGCSKLDKVPISQKSVEGFYQTENQINQAVIGGYNGLRTVWVTSQTSYMLTESRSDNTMQGVAYDDGAVSRFEVKPDLAILSTAWSQYYHYINSCNQLLKASPNVQMDDIKRKQYEGEAKFQRALFYFDLVRLFGGVPIVTTPITIKESYGVKRSTVEDVYNLIVKDLTEAIEDLPLSYNDTNTGRATKWAAKGFLGKVYLFRSGYPLQKNEWEKASALFKEIINSGQFQFFANYEDIYNFSFESDKQQVFSIKFKAGANGNGNPFPTRNASNDIKPVSSAQGGLPFGGSPYNLFLSGDLVNSYEDGDIRKEVSILSSWLHKSGEIITTLPTCKKYQNGTVVAANDWDIDWIALSYTDVLMMYAECLNELSYVPSGESFTILNNVRQRAKLSPKTATEIPDQQSFRLWMEKERRHEFAFENLRWFDLVRTDRALDVMKHFLTPYGFGANLKGKEQYIYPIPQSVIDVTPSIEQNPGY